VCDVRKKGPYKDVVVSVRFPERIKRMMEQVAYSEGLDLSAWVRNLVIAELKRRGVLPEAVSAYGLEAAIERLKVEGVAGTGTGAEGLPSEKSLGEEAQTLATEPPARPLAQTTQTVERRARASVGTATRSTPQPSERRSFSGGPEREEESA
jgi:hypothetical protein